MDDQEPDCEWCGAPASNVDDVRLIAKLKFALSRNWELSIAAQAEIFLISSFCA